MMFWLWALLTMAVMFAVLLVAPEQHLTQDWSFLHGIATHGLTPWLLALSSGLVGAFMLLSRRKFYVQRGRVRWLFGLMSALCLCVLVALFGLRVFLVHNAYDATRLDVPIKVKARVQVYEISDGVYDALAGASYRQKAIIDNLQPVSTDTQATVINPYHNPAQDAALAQLDETAIHALPERLTVLLSTPARAGMASDFNALNQLTAGQQMTMTLSLSAIKPEQSTGFDGYRWHLSRHIHASARILSVDADSLAPIVELSFAARLGVMLEQMRQHYRDVFYENWHQKTRDEQQGRAVTLSLLTGDRALIDTQTRALYQLAGISHLLAISGAHVLFFAWLLSALGVSVVNRWSPRLYRRVARREFKLGLMVLAAFIYAVFVGFDVPAVRTVYMLLAVGVARYLMLGWSHLRVLALVALVMVWLDPYALWQAALWLSFVAVAFLMGESDADDTKQLLGVQKTSSITGTFLGMLRLQLFVFVCMLPISVLLFGKVSLFGLLVNLFAVGLFGWVVVPLNLAAGVIYAVLPNLATAIWTILSVGLAALAQFFDVLSLYAAQAYLTLPMNAALALLGVLAVLLLQGWLPLPRRLSVLPVLMMVLAWVSLGDKKSTEQPMLTLQALQSTAADSSAVLVRYGDDAWLMLSAQPSRHTRSDERMADSLLMQLRGRGVMRLTGIVVQNPDETLNKLAGRINLAMPVGHLWTSGQTARYGRLYSQLCQAGKTWQSADGSLSLQAMTGWAELPDDAMHGCTLWLHGKMASKWIAFDAHESISDTDGADDGTQKSVQMWAHTSVVIDGARDDGLWQLWQLMCHDGAGLGVSPTQVNALISHSRSPMAPKWVVALSAAPILSDVAGNDNARSQQQARLQALLHAKADER